jgi:hypothetical protein
MARKTKKTHDIFIFTNHPSNELALTATRLSGVTKGREEQAAHQAAVLIEGKLHAWRGANNT